MSIITFKIQEYTKMNEERYIAYILRLWKDSDTGPWRASL